MIFHDGKGEETKSSDKSVGGIGRSRRSAMSRTVGAEMNPWSVWLDPWQGYLDQWSKALGGNIFRLHRSIEPCEITQRKSATPYRVALESNNFALLDFSREDNQITMPPALIVTPYALHDWRIADLAHYHSLVEALINQGVTSLYVLAWKSAQFETRHNRIDSQFDALSQVINHFGKAVNVVGLCQGGWLSLAYVARFPEAFSRLALIGAPVDFAHSAATIHAMDDNLIDASINWLSLAGGGVIRGWSTQSLWRIKFGEGSDRSRALEETDADITAHPVIADIYDAWDADVLDLPPVYFGDVLKQLYRDNDMIEGRFKVLDQCISLKSVTCPLLIMIGRDDEVVPEDQIGTITNSVSTPLEMIQILQADCGHLALFLGKKTLENQWPVIARWLLSPRTETSSN